MAHIAGAFGRMTNFCARFGEGENPARQVGNGESFAVANIELARHAGSRDGENIGRGDVADKNEITRLATVAEDRQRLVGEGALNEDGHRGGVGAVGILTWA